MKRGKKVIKALLLTLVVSVIAVGSVHAYATTFLNAGALDVIKVGVNDLKNHYVQEAKLEIEKEAIIHKANIDAYVNEKADTIVTDIDAHTSKEVTKAKSQLEAELTLMKKETDEVVDKEVNLAKEEITNEVAKKVQTTKTELAEKLNAKLIEKIKEKQTNIIK